MELLSLVRHSWSNHWSDTCIYFYTIPASVTLLLNLMSLSIQFSISCWCVVDAFQFPVAAVLLCSYTEIHEFCMLSVACIKVFARDAGQMCNSWNMCTCILYSSFSLQYIFATHTQGLFIRHLTEHAAHNHYHTSFSYDSICGLNWLHANVLTFWGYSLHGVYLYKPSISRVYIRIIPHACRTWRSKVKIWFKSVE